MNIALINEFSEIFSSLQIDTEDVLSSKPNGIFSHSNPVWWVATALVDPYYLTYKAKKVGVDPKIILAGRRTNDKCLTDLQAMSING